MPSMLLVSSMLPPKANKGRRVACPTDIDRDQLSGPHDDIFNIAMTTRSRQSRRNEVLETAWEFVTAPRRKLIRRMRRGLKVRSQPETLRAPEMMCPKH